MPMNTRILIIIWLHVTIRYGTQYSATSLASQPYLSACACVLGGAGEGKEKSPGDYSTVFVSPAGICGSPMKLHQPCDIAEHYVTST